MRKVTIGLLLAAVLIVAADRAYIHWHSAMPQVPLVIGTAEGPVQLTVEVASTRSQQEQGLMYRKSLAPNAGMLFDLHREMLVGFWMKNTLIPLDMIFINGNGTIILVVANAKPLSLQLMGSRKPVRAVLEIAGGRAAALGIERGDRVKGSIFGQAPPSVDRQGGASPYPDSKK